MHVAAGIHAFDRDVCEHKNDNCAWCSQVRDGSEMSKGDRKEDEKHADGQDGGPLKDQAVLANCTLKGGAGQQLYDGCFSDAPTWGLVI